MKQVLISKMNNGTDHMDDNSSSKLCNQGVNSKELTVFNNGSQSVNGVQNGNALSSERISQMNFSQNGASSSSATFAPSASPSTSPPHLSSCDVSNGEHLREKLAAKGRSLSSEENERLNSDKKRKTGNWNDNESLSGNEDDGLSEDECCIYTYKGDQFADLPNSFFPVNMPANERDQEVRENDEEANPRRRSWSEEDEESNAGSSPEMDYLEMDFDPGPSLDQDSEEFIDVFDKKSDSSEIPELTSEEVVVSGHNGENVKSSSVVKHEGSPQPGPSNENMFWCSQEMSDERSDSNSNNVNRTKELVKTHYDGFCLDDDNSQTVGSSSQGTDDESTSESSSSHFFRGKRLNKKYLTERNDLCSTLNESETDLNAPFTGIMLWTEEEAIAKQVTLLSSEVSCGAAAVINVMLALKLRFTVEKVKEGISSRFKSESMTIPQYLLSRSLAGERAHENLIRGIGHASQGKLHARFYQMYPRRKVILSRWLTHWMKKGVVPIATINSQRNESGEEAAVDTRHHMIFGVSPKGIHLTNPVECLEDDELWRRLNNTATIKVKRKEIVSRWSEETNLRPLMYQSDERWTEMNVLGQVVNVIRQSLDPKPHGKFLTEYISIPASSGITLVVTKDSPAYEELNAPLGRSSRK